MSTSIKKDYQAIYEILEANANKKVSTILPQLVELMSRKSNGSGEANTFRRDEDGNVTHVFCYYHKEWEDVTECEYGKKASTATGLNTMCKVGANQWSKQQRAKKKAEAELLERVIAGELQPDDIADAKAKILEESKVIVPRGEVSEVKPKAKPKSKATPAEGTDGEISWN